MGGILYDVVFHKTSLATSVITEIFYSLFIAPGMGVKQTQAEDHVPQSCLWC